MDSPSKRILFVCYANACRSQMAEGFARTLGPDDLEVQSAGIMAAGLFGETVASMAKVGIDISRQTSKSVNQLELSSFDLIVTLSDQAHTQLLRRHPGLTLLHHPVLDPAGVAGTYEERMKIFDLTREDVHGVVLEVLAQIARESKRA